MTEKSEPEKLTPREALSQIQKRLSDVASLTPCDRDGLVLVAALLLCRTPGATIESRACRVLDSLIPKWRTQAWFPKWLREFADIVDPKAIGKATQEQRVADLRRWFVVLGRSARDSGTIGNPKASVRYALVRLGEEKAESELIENLLFLLGTDGKQRYFVTRKGRLILSVRSIRDAMKRHAGLRRPRENNPKFIMEKDGDKPSLLDTAPARDETLATDRARLVDALDALDKLDRRPAWRAAIHYLRNNCCSRAEAAKEFGATMKALRVAETKVIAALRQRMQDAG